MAWSRGAKGLLTFMLLAVMLAPAAGAPLTGVALAAPIVEDPDSSFATPLALSQIGFQSPVNATIGVAGDEDGFSFVAQSGKTYVVELFNVSTSLAQGRTGYTECAGGYDFYYGMVLLAYDPITSSSVAGQCIPNGGGNVLLSVAVKAGSTGQLKLKAYAHIPSAIGTYSLRVLPMYAEDGAGWDTTTFEPNNRQENAYAINVGRERVITSKIDERDSIYATNSGDNDWYRFEGVSGRTYTVELYNVSTSLAQGRTGYIECAGGYGFYSGLTLLAFDTSTKSRIAGQCNPNGNGNVLVSTTFKVGSNGAFTLLVYGHNPASVGNYSLRVLPKYGEEGASWDEATTEPNDREANAYQIGVGSDKALITSIEQRNSIFATSSGDADWYRFDATSGETYVVELYNVSTSLGQGRTGYIECAGQYGFYSGLALLAFDTGTNSRIAGQCSPNGNGTVSVRLTFKAAASGVYTLLVFPHNGDAFGSYSIRVRPASEAYRALLPLVRK